MAKKPKAKKQQSKKGRSNKAIPSNSSFKFELGVAFALIFCGLAFLYGRTLDNPLLYDSEYLQEVSFYKGWLKWSSLFQLRFMTKASFAIGYELWGEVIRFHRLVNVLIHGLNGVLVFVVVRLFLSQLLDDDSKKIHWYSLFVAIFFVLNPISLYATAYLVQRLVLLGTFFSLITIYSVLRGLLSKSFSWLGFGLFSYLLAVYSKEHVVLTLPVVLVLAYCLREKLEVEWHKHGWFLAGAFLVALTVFFQSKQFIAQVYEPHGQMVLNDQWRELRPTRVLSGPTPENVYTMSVGNQMYSFFRYLFLWLLPYTRWMAFDIQFPFPAKMVSHQIVLGWIFFVTTFCGAVYFLTREASRRLYGLAILIPMIWFATELVTVRYSENFVLYRSYIWMPFVGLCFWPLVRRINSKQLSIGATLFLLLFFAVHQNRLKPFSSMVEVWKDSLVRLTAQDDQLATSYRVYDLLAYGLLKEKRFYEALDPLKRSLELKPNYVYGNHNMGVLKENLGSYEEAREYYTKAVLLRYNGQEHPMMRSELASVLTHLGNGLVQKGEIKRSYPFFEQAMKIDPVSSEAQNGMGIYLAMDGKLDEAFGYFETALKLNPKSIAALTNFGETLYLQSEFEKAYRVFSKAIEYEGTMGKAWYFLGHIQTKGQQFERAIEAYQKAIRYDFRPAEATYNIAVNHIHLGHNEKGISYLKKALALNPNYQKAKEALNHFQGANQLPVQ